MKKLPPKNKKEKGAQAEELAVQHLTAKGYRIVDRNFRCKMGEIDIIASHEDYLVFVEVRAKYSANTVSPAYSVNWEKQKKIGKVAAFYVGIRFQSPPLIRFDVVIVNMVSEPQIELIPDAFQVDAGAFYL